MMTEQMLQAYLGTLRLDWSLYRESIREVSNDIIHEGYSKYPVFIAHQEEVRLGEIILDRNELGTGFTIQATTLEELLEMKVVQQENKEKFIEAYKDPSVQCCIFLITPHGARFIFIPYDQASGGSGDNS